MVSLIRNDQAVFVQRLLLVEKTINQLQFQIGQLPEAINQAIKSANPISSNLACSVVTTRPNVAPEGNEE
ncbi:unnamed protein product [Dicrocoelium dendriticum]|nr:unnamed protein product [Dicrocoelium dendriticum]